MQDRRLLIVYILIGLAIGSMSVQIAAAQTSPFKNLPACKEGAFSTEEDFMMMEGTAYDGSPYVSDGDVLSPSGQVCVRNADLLNRFDVTADLGLDGLDILNFDPGLIAFSTELDSPFGTFTAGDLLITNGVIIPNLALVAPFGINYNVGLDELKFMGSDENIMRFIEFASQTPADAWKENFLAQALRRFNIDIWFSIEGTVWRPERPILDGDLLSARGTVIATNRELLALSVPAGLPKDGVDFGLDAFSIPREALGSRNPDILFSTEILFNGKPKFTDGDVLVRGGGVVISNQDLVSAFKPAADFLGLDALWFAFDQPIGPRITHLCDIPTIEFNGGTVAIGGSGTGLRETALTSPPALTDTYTQPCGQDVPIRGFLTTNPSDPVGNVKRFRVAFREASEPVPANSG